MTIFYGTPGNDSLTGTAGNDTFLGSAGNDTISGGDGFDTLNYVALGQAVRISLSNGGVGTVEKPGTPNPYDSFDSVERLVGTRYDDVFVGSIQFGTTSFVGDLGRDTFYGFGRVTNVADYSDSATPVIVDMAAGVVLVGDRSNVGNSDRLVEVVSVYGSQGDDLFLGSQAINDFFYGAEGNDTFVGGASPSGALGGNFSGGRGTDTVQFTAALSDLSFQFTFSRDPGASGTTSIQSGLDGVVYVDNVERITAGGRTYGQGVGVSGVDTIGYYVRNTDVASAGRDAEQHYFTDGWREGRDPNVSFSTNTYLGVHTDVRAAGVNPLLHYLTDGSREGRDPTLNFDSETYLGRNPDVRAAGINPYLHYLESGAQEGRATAQAIGPGAGLNGFDREFYLFANADVRAAGVDAETHFRTVGISEGRNPDAWFDTRAYLTAYQDVAAAGVDPLNHYVTQGWREGRDPSARFDNTLYLAANPDVAAAGINPLLHYLTDGHAEGRVPPTDNVFN